MRNIDKILKALRGALDKLKLKPVAVLVRVKD